MSLLYQGAPGTSDTLLFTAERRYTHLTITCTNVTGSDAAITLNVAYQGAAAANTNAILKAAVVPANKAGLLELGVNLNKGDTMRGLNGTSGAITVLIDGLNIEQSSHSRGSSMSFFPPETNVTVNTVGATSPLTTKGDVWGYDSADNRIPIGADTNVLTADSAQPLGLKWAPAATTSPLTTKGDIFTRSTVDARLPVGTNAQIVQADSAQTTGNRWATISRDATLATGGALTVVGIQTRDVDTTLPNANGMLYVWDNDASKWVAKSVSSDATLAKTGALTLATVNGNVGSFGDSTDTVTVTVNAKGLITAISQQAMPNFGLGFYGDGSDSTQTFDGTTAILGMTPSSNIYTLVRDLYLQTSSLTGSAVLKTNGFRVFCTGTLTVGASATIQANGANAGTAPAGGGSQSPGSIGAGSNAGGAGHVGSGSGTGGGSPSPSSMGGAGGAGGFNGGGGTGGGTAGGSVAPPTAVAGVPRHAVSAISGRNTSSQVYLGGAGGAGGNGDTNTTGGGGGCGGDVISIIAKAIVNNGTISAKGGTGGNATGTGGLGAGGGGGGGGGLALLIYGSFTGNAASVAAGNGGSPYTTGATGATGSVGTIITIPNG